IEQWEVESYVPSVVVNPFHLDEDEFETFDGFAANGEAVSLDSEEEPTVPVVVLGVNERTNDEGLILPQFQATEDADQNLRVSGEYEYLKKFRVTNLSAIEKWGGGKPEIELYVYIPRRTSSGSFSFYQKFLSLKPKRSEVDMTWYTMNTGLFNWILNPTSSSSSVYSDELFYFWNEYDGGGNLTVSFSIPGKFKLFGGGVQTNNFVYDIQIHSNDDPGGEMYIEFDDPKSTIHSTTYFQSQQD
ncbi:MAG: hypothetical protein AAFQ68_12245, partial [Bacteroidota bacterium]